MSTKKIYGFKVKLNNTIVCRAGFEKENSVVSCILTSIRREKDLNEELAFDVGGLNSETDQYVDWYKNSLKEGDKITIEVITKDFDPPTTIRNSERKK